jgi:hypothetical protein
LLSVFESVLAAPHCSLISAVIAETKRRRGASLEKSAAA